MAQLTEHIRIVETGRFFLTMDQEQDDREAPVDGMGQVLSVLREQTTQTAEAGVRVDYIAFIQMVDNYLPAFDAAKQMSMDKHVFRLPAAGAAFLIIQGVLLLRARSF